MADQTVTALAFVRTESGVVKVLPGERVPRNALPGEQDRLDGILVPLPEPESNDPDDKPTKPRRPKAAEES